MVSLESTTLGGVASIATPLSQWCQHPDGFSVAYPEDWSVAGMSGRECNLFGAVPFSEFAWESEMPPAPVSLNLRTDSSFDDIVAPSRAETVTSQQDELIGSLRIARIESVLNDNGADDYVPDGTPKVTWVVELPPAGNGGVLIGTAFPNGVVGGGVAEDAQRDSMDVTANAAVLDAMIRSLVFTVFDDTVTLNESLELGFSGVGKATLGMSMTDFAGALGAGLKDVYGGEQCSQAYFVADSTEFFIVSSGGRNGPVQAVQVGLGQRPARGLPVAGTAEGIRLGSTYADVIKAYPSVVVRPAPHSAGGERLTVVDGTTGRALAFDTNATGEVVSMISGSVEMLNLESIGCE